MRISGRNITKIDDRNKGMNKKMKKKRGRERLKQLRNEKVKKSKER